MRARKQPAEHIVRQASSLCFAAALRKNRSYGKFRLKNPFDIRRSNRFVGLFICVVCDVILCTVLWEWHKESTTAPENQAFHSIKTATMTTRATSRCRSISMRCGTSAREKMRTHTRARTQKKKRRNGCLKTKHARRRCNIRRIYHREQQTNVCKRNSSARRRASLSVVPQCGDRTRCAMCV